MNPTTYKIAYGDTLSGIARARGTTVAEILKANPSIKDPNRIRAGATLNFGSSTTTPTIPTQTKSTIADRASRIPDFKSNLESPELSGYYADQKNIANEPIDEKTLRDQIRARYNDQFSALRLAAAEKKAQAYKEGLGRAGTAYATQARSGTLGSTFATAENNQVEDTNRSIQNSIDAELEAKIAYLNGEVESDYSNQIKTQREAKQKGADEYIKYLTTRDSQRTEAASKLAKLFAAQGVDIKTLTKEELSKLESTYGISGASFEQMVNNEKTALAEKNTVTLTEGQQKYVKDPVTGEYKLVAENKKDFAPKAVKTAGTGTGSGVGGGGSAYSNDLDALIGNVAAGITAKNQREAFNASIGRARNDQDKISAVAKVLNITGDSRADLTNTQIGQNNLRGAISLLKNGTQTGVITSGKDYLFNLTGNQVSPELTQLKQLIVAAVQPYRNSVTGAAWGTQEEQEYQSLFGSIKDTPETLLTKLESLDRIMTNKRIGIIQSYADPFGANTSFNTYTQPYNTSAPNPGDTKTINGQLYRKVEGGWQKVK